MFQHNYGTSRAISTILVTHMNYYYQGKIVWGVIHALHRKGEYEGGM